MNLQEFVFGDERAVSPVVGVALLIAIAVILAAVIGAVVLGLGTGGVDTPQAQLVADFDADGDGNVSIAHNGGEPIPADHVVFVDESGSNATIGDDLTAGNTADFDSGDLAGLTDGDTVTLIWQDPNSNSETVLERFEP